MPKLQKRKSKKSIKKMPKKAVDNRRALSDIQAERLKKMYASGKYQIADISAKFNISIQTMYNYLNRK